jgi:hypothetical protein
MIAEQACEGAPGLFPAAAAPPSLDATVALAKRHFATILVGAAFFGATLGMHRGGIQILYAALKLPLVVLLTAVVCTPVLTSLNRALNRRAVLAEDLSLVLASLARGCLILAALAPVHLLAALAKVDYHKAVLLAVGSCALAGVAGLAVLVRGLWQERSARRFVTLALLVVVAMAGTRMTWTLRPYLVRPCVQVVPFMRALDGSFMGSVSTSFDSARGQYRSNTCGEGGL